MSGPVTARVARAARVLLALTLATVLAACAPLHPPASTPSATSASYSGRMSLQLDAAAPLGAEFELQGDARAGRLALSGPLGQTVAVLLWSPTQATLMQGSEQHVSASASELVERLTGAPLPWNAFFSWLAGEAVQVAGWQVDLSRHADGRIAARRLEPAPRVDLRLQLVR